MLAASCPRRLRLAMRARLCPLRPCAALDQSLWQECARASCGCWTPADRYVDPFMSQVHTHTCCSRLLRAQV